MDLFIQFVGFVGIMLLLTIFQVNNRKTILYLQIISCIVWALYYALLSSYTPAVLIAIGGVRSYLFEKYREHEWIYEMMIVIYAVATLVTWKNETTILALIGMIIATTALWQKHPRMIRLVSLPAVPFWIAYDVLNGSYMGLIGDMITMTSVVVGFLRFDALPYIRRRWSRPETNDLGEVV